MLDLMRNKLYTISSNYGHKIGLDLPYFVKNGFWMFLRLIINSSLMVVLYIVLSRFFSQEMFGQYQFILSIISIAYIFSIPGLNDSLLRSVARKCDGDYRFAVRKSFLGSSVGSIVLFLIGTYYFYSLNRSLGISLMISSIFLPFFYAPNTWAWFLLGKHQFNVLARFSIVQMTLNTSCTIVVIFLARNNLILLTTTYLASYTFFNCFFYYKSLRYIENNKKDAAFLKYGWFLTKIHFSGIIANNVDKIIVALLLGPTNLAIYTVMTLIVFRMKDLFKSTMVLFFPKMSTLNESFLEITILHKKKFYVLLAGLIGMSIVYYLSIPFVNEWMFTEKYSQYSYISQIFTITFFLSAPVSFLGYYINATKNEFAIILTNPIFYTIQLILTVCFILRWGLLGAAVALNLSMLIMLFFYIYGIVKKEGIKNKKSHA